MVKFKILSVGKTREAWLEMALQEYIKRLQPVAIFEFQWAKDDAQLLRLVSREEFYVCLDPTGRLMTSEQFSDFLQETIVRQGGRMTFIIGGPEGLPESLRKQGTLISLSPLTFTHQVTRLILVEQIYRSFEIAKGSRYHK